MLRTRECRWAKKGHTTLVGVSTGVGGCELRGWAHPCVEGYAHLPGWLLLAAAARPVCPSYPAHALGVWGAGGPL